MSTSLCTDSEIEAEETTGEAGSGSSFELTRRSFLKSASALATAVGLPAAAIAHDKPQLSPQLKSITLHVNGQAKTVSVDTRISLLDTLREHLDLTGTKKGCDHGQCGSCTVLLDGRRVNACLTLAVVADGAKITSIEGLAQGEQLHPMQTSFLEHDGYQCGYCTPGQILSAVATVDEIGRNELSVVSFRTGKIDSPQLTDDEIRERMSGNICRCGAYPNIVAAVRAVARQSRSNA